MENKQEDTLKVLIIWLLIVFFLFITSISHASSISLYGGTATNNSKNEQGTAWQVEYEYKSSSPFALSASYLNEGHNLAHKRDGFIVQGKLYLPIPSDRFETSVSAGGYRWYDTQPQEVVRGFAGVFGINASYKYTEKVSLRAQWNRIESDDHRDSDVFLLGVGYNWSH